jgi:hypothetical protein
MFQMTLPGYLPLVSGGPLLSFLSTDPTVNSCVPCVDPPLTALYFLRGGTSDLIQFKDQDGTNYLYTFPVNSLSQAGRYSTLPGININKGTLNVTVTATPEPSAAVLFAIGLCTVLLGLRLRRRALED